jgi:hypothetical protein
MTSVSAARRRTRAVDRVAQMPERLETSAGRTIKRGVRRVGLPVGGQAGACDRCGESAYDSDFSNAATSCLRPSAFCFCLRWRRRPLDAPPHGALAARVEILGEHD